MKSRPENFGSILNLGQLIPRGSWHDLRPSKDHPDVKHLQKWKDEIWLRDEGRCQSCGLHADQTESGWCDVHHLTYKRFGAEILADGVLLCRPCHEFVTYRTRKARRRRLKNRRRVYRANQKNHFKCSRT
jgi:5-methylcytosine-specific restriction endonuclease McrA